MEKDIFSGNIYVYKDHLVGYMMEKDSFSGFKAGMLKGSIKNGSAGYYPAY